MDKTVSRVISEFLCTVLAWSQADRTLKDDMGGGGGGDILTLL